jgi:hypothetical protein
VLLGKREEGLEFLIRFNSPVYRCYIEFPRAIINDVKESPPIPFTSAATFLAGDQFGWGGFEELSLVS